LNVKLLAVANAIDHKFKTTKVFRYIMTPTSENVFLSNRNSFHPVVDFDPSVDRLIAMDFTAANEELTNDIIEDTSLFSLYLKNKLETAKARYGIGGYAEHRTVYSRSGVFDADTPDEEPRRLHLGVDIWGKAGNTIHAPLDGSVHSFAFNNHYGDYGATIILEHKLENLHFFSLYGHLSLKDITRLSKGTSFRKGEVVAHFGPPEENGHWPPHLHLQLIYDLENATGDYPGVCKFSERESYLANCPDPDLIINMNRYIAAD
jgi:peptidoglycan LD-endopeptidase LytH